MNSNTMCSFLNLEHIRSYLSRLAWKQSSPCNELLPGVFLPVGIFKIIITKPRSSICTQLAVLMAATFPSLTTKAAALSFHPKATDFPVPVAVPVESIEVEWDGITTVVERRQVRSEGSTVLRRGGKPDQQSWLFFSFGEEGGIDEVEGKWLLLGGAVWFPT